MSVESKREKERFGGSCKFYYRRVLDTIDRYTFVAWRSAGDVAQAAQLRWQGRRNEVLRLQQVDATKARAEQSLSTS